MPDLSRAEVIALIVSKAREYGLVDWEFLGGAIAESNLDPHAYRDGPWPDKSPGLFQQTIRYADEGDQSDSPENVALIKRLYFDPVHACDVAARKYRYWRYDPDVPALTAWVAYNSPGFYHTPEESPNVENYRAGLAEAQRILGAAPMPTTATYDPHTPPERQVQDWACSIRTATWMARSLGVPIDAGTMQDIMTPHYVTPADGLLDGRGYGLAEVLRSVLPAAAAVSVHEAASWDDVMSWAGSGPIGMGSHKLYHWLAVREPDDEGALSGMNPAPGWKVVGDQITRAEFDAWAPWNVVRVQLAGSVSEPSSDTPKPEAYSDETANGLRIAVAHLADVVAEIDDRPRRLAEARAIREQFVGPRP